MQWRGGTVAKRERALHLDPVRVHDNAGQHAPEDRLPAAVVEAVDAPGDEAAVAYRGCMAVGLSLPSRNPRPRFIELTAQSRDLDLQGRLALVELLAVHPAIEEQVQVPVTKGRRAAFPALQRTGEI
jgi:hypothetical protein